MILLSARMLAVVGVMAPLALAGCGTSVAKVGPPQTPGQILALTRQAVLKAGTFDARLTTALVSRGPGKRGGSADISYRYDAYAAAPLRYSAKGSSTASGYGPVLTHSRHALSDGTEIMNSERGGFACFSASGYRLTGAGREGQSMVPGLPDEGMLVSVTAAGGRQKRGLRALSVAYRVTYLISPVPNVAPPEGVLSGTLVVSTKSYLPVSFVATNWNPGAMDLSGARYVESLRITFTGFGGSEPNLKRVSRCNVPGR